MIWLASMATTTSTASTSAASEDFGKRLPRRGFPDPPGSLKRMPFVSWVIRRSEHGPDEREAAVLASEPAHDLGPSLDLAERSLEEVG